MKSSITSITFLVSLLMILLSSCDKQEDENPAFGFQTENREQVFNRISGSLSELEHPDNYEYSFQFQGSIADNPIELRGVARDSFQSQSHPDSYGTFHLDQSLRRISSVPYVVVGDSEGVIPFVTLWFSFTNEAEDVVDMKWHIPYVGTDPVREDHFIGDVLNSFFVPGEQHVIHDYATRDSTTLGLAADFETILMEPFGERFSMRATPNTSRGNTIICTGFETISEGESVRYIVDFDINHELSGAHWNRNPGVASLNGSVHIDYAVPN